MAPGKQAVIFSSWSHILLQPHASLKPMSRLLGHLPGKTLAAFPSHVWIDLEQPCCAGNLVGVGPSNCAEHFHITSDWQDEMTFCLCLWLSEAVHACVISLWYFHSNWAGAEESCDVCPIFGDSHSFLKYLLHPSYRRETHWTVRCPHPRWGPLHTAIAITEKQVWAWLSPCPDICGLLMP